MICVLWLTHWGRVTHICVSKLTIIGSDQPVPSHCGSQYWNIVNLTLRNKLQCNIYLFFFTVSFKNAFGIAVWKMEVIWSWPQCVDTYAIMWLFILYDRDCCHVLIFNIDVITCFYISDITCSLTVITDAKQDKACRYYTLHRWIHYKKHQICFVYPN